METAQWCEEHGRPQQALIAYRAALKLGGDDPKVNAAIERVKKQLQNNPQ